MRMLREGDDVFGYLRKVRTVAYERDVVAVVAATIEDVRSRGDQAVLESARRFDCPHLENLSVSAEELDAAILPPDQDEAIRIAVQRVARFHLHQRNSLDLGSPFGADDRGTIDLRVRVPVITSWSMAGGLGQTLRPLDSAGIYVPGGRAAYPSSVVMNAVPAMVAGVRDVAVTTPARPDGSLHPAVLLALRELGVVSAYKVGGAAAIAALALGTETIKRVDKIAGPGNKYVNEAKRQLWGTVGLDGYAGPSEVTVLADSSANPRFAAADLLTQIEHAPDNAAYLVATEGSVAMAILAEVERQLAGAPREQVMREALQNHGVAIVARDLEHAVDVVNAIAPEHLSLAVGQPEKVLEKIQNAGCVLLGEWSPESAGDFVAGPSHTLPTSGAARFGSPVNVLDFLKVQSVIHMRREDLEGLVATIEAFGEMEGFPTHASGARIRME